MRVAQNNPHGAWLAPYLNRFLSRGLRPATRRAYAQALRQFFDDDPLPAGIGSVDTARIGAWRDRLLAGGNSAATVNRKLAALRGFLDALVDEGVLASNPARLTRVRPLKVRRATMHPSPDPAQTESLVRACEDGTARGARDKAIILMMALHGLRRGRFAALSGDSLTRHEGVTLMLGEPLHPRVVEALDAWIRLGPVTPDASRPLFYSLSPNGGPTQGVVRPLSGFAVNLIVKKRARRAGLDGVTPRSLRRARSTGHMEAAS